MSTDEQQQQQNQHGITLRQFQQCDLPTVQRLFKEGFQTYNLIFDRQPYIKEVLSKDLGDVNKYYLDVPGGNFFVAEYTAPMSLKEEGVMSCFHGSS